MTDLAAGIMKDVFKDWETMVGFSAEIDTKEVHVGNGGSNLSPVLEEPHLVVTTQMLGSFQGPVYFAFPCQLAIRIIADVLMIPEQAQQDRTDACLDEVELEAFKEMANLLCGTSNLFFQKAGGDQRISQSVDHLKVWASPQGTCTMAENIPDERVVCAQLDAAGEDWNHPVLCIFSLDLARSMAEQSLEANP